MQSKGKLKEFEIQTKLGFGSYGTIFRVMRKSDKRIYVLKQINLTNLKEKMRKNAINQATILSRLNNPFIVRYLQSFIDENKLNIIMEYCEGGDLALLLKQQLGRPLKEDKIWKIFLQICLGLQYIHQKRILHRDIKTLNIFLTKDETVKIGDLGVAKLLQDNADFAQTMVGTPFYLSPELCQQKPYNEKSDIWALGCLLYQMCTFRHPFEAANQASLILKIIRGKYNSISESYSKQLRETIDHCLERDYKRRPTANLLLSKPFLKQKCVQFGLRGMIQKQQKENKKIFVMKLQNQLNRIEQQKQKDKEKSRQQKPMMKATPSQQNKDKSKSKVTKIYQEVKKEAGKKQEIRDLKRQELKRQQQKKQEQKRQELKKREQQKREQQRKAEQKRQQQKKQEQRIKQQIKKQEQRREQLKKEQQQKQLKKKMEEIKKKQQQQQKILVQKVKFEKQIKPKIYEKKIISTKQISKLEQKKIPKLLNDIETPPSRVIIKSKAFIHEPSYSQDIFDNHKLNQKKLINLSYEDNQMIHKKRSSVNPFQQKIIPQPKIPIQFENRNLIPPLPGGRIRKGAPIQKSRNAKNPIRSGKHVITHQQQEMVANLPDKGSSDSDDNQIDQKILKKTDYSNMGSFKLKNIDNDEVLKKYQQLLKQEEKYSKSQDQVSRVKDTNINTTNIEQSNITQNLKKQNLENSSENSMHFDEENNAQIEDSQQIREELLQNSNANFNNNQIIEDLSNQQVLQSNIEPITQSNNNKQVEWDYDQQPELADFEQANIYLMQQKEEENIEDTKKHLQKKLAENLKRQDELNQLMQLRVDQCKKSFKNFYDEAIELFRRKINMDREYNQQDQVQIDTFLRNRKLTDARKFQSIYKIMHFEMELENCRNIIQGICKKLNDFQKV